MNRNTTCLIKLVVLKYVVLLICGGLSLSALAAPPKPALIRDVDREGSASAMLACSVTLALSCSVTTTIPAGKRFISSYISYTVNFNVGTVPIEVKICSQNPCSGGKFAVLPIAGAVVFIGANIFSTGTPITFVFEAGETPFFVLSPTTLTTANFINLSILGHFEDI